MEHTSPRLENQSSAWSADDIAVELRLRSLRAISMVLPVLAVIYALTAVQFLVAPPFFPAEQCIWVAVIGAACSLILWGAIRPDDPRFDTPVVLLTIAITVGQALSMLAISGELANTATLSIALVAGGALLHRLWLYLVMIVVVFAGWAPLAQGYSTSQFSLWVFYLAAASALGTLILISRRSMTLRLYQQAHQADAMRRLATEQAGKLARARDAALASAQAKGQFLANVSHEIRTPLNGILGLLQLIEASALPKPQDDYLREVYKSGRSLLAIVNDLLDLSKIEAGAVRLESVPFDVVTMVEEVAANHAAAATAKSIELLTEVDGRVPAEVCGDPLRLRQVVTNLVNNALKFTREGEVVVGVRHVGGGPTHVELELRVSDTGVGISKEQRERIFRPFSQADASTTREYGGTGLGLPISRQLVELMGGTLQVRSVVNKGSTFYFTVRLELEDKLSEEMKFVTQALGGMQVLLLESNNRARATRSTQFESWNMVVSETTTFEAAMQRFERDPTPDVALIDLRSLGQEWRSRAEQLAKVATKSGSALIALCSQAQDVSAVLDAGIQVHLEKPVRRAKLIAALLDALNRDRATQDSGGVPDSQPLPSVPSPQPLTTGMRILVAEDNDTNQKVVEAHLRTLGYEVDTVSDGEAALEALGPDHSYAAVIMDGQMPNMDGYEATKALRAREAETKQTRVPVIALTAHAMTGDRTTAMAAGMDDYLSKPFTQKQLHKALNRWAVRPDATGSEFPPDALDPTITAQLLELEEDRPGFLVEVIDSFLRTAEENLAQMREAVASKDIDALRASAHMIKGSSQQLGARRFGSTCLKLEELSTLDGAELLLNDLTAELEGARDALTGLADRVLDAAS